MKLVHPTDANVNKNVPDEVAQKWLDNGWTEAEAETDTEPKPARKRTTKKP